MTIYTVRLMARDARAIWRGTKDETQSLRRFEVACDLLGLDTPLASVRTAKLDGLVEELRARGLSDSTIHRYLATVSAALRWACARDYIVGLPIIPWTKTGDARDVVISKEDDGRLLTWLRDHGLSDVALVYDVLLATGCRIGELLSLDPSDIDVYEGEVTFRNTKNGDDRTVPLQPDLAVDIKHLIESGIPSYTIIRRAAIRAQKVLGIEHSITPHIMRHSAATRLAADGDVSMKTIGKLLGHRSEKTTARYLHPEKHTIRRAASKLVRS
jgi:integrase